jgi:hypothetical protein
MSDEYTDQLTLLKEKIVSLMHVNGIFFDDVTYIESIANMVALRFSAHMWAYKHEPLEVKYPATWWDAFKKQYAPNWFVNHYPVKYNKHLIVVREYSPQDYNPSDMRELVELQKMTPPSWPMGAEVRHIENE